MPAKKAKQAKPKATKKEEPAKKEEAPAENGDPKAEEVENAFVSLAIFLLRPLSQIIYLCASELLFSVTSHMADFPGIYPKS